MRIRLSLVLLAGLLPLAGSAPEPPLAPRPALAAAPTVPGTSCPALPADNVWNADVSALPVHPSSAAWLTSSGAAAGRNLHPDFGSYPYGIPFNVVGSAHATAALSFLYASESDPGGYPYGSDLVVEAPTDSHLLTINRDTCTLFETGGTDYNGPRTAWAGATFNLGSDALRPAEWTSADAAGLPIFPGLLRWDEVAAGSVNHAVRFTVQSTDRSYVWPARHQAGSASNPNLPPMGARFRLKAGYDVSGFGREAQVVLSGFKHYGVILADNGSNWFFQGTSDNRWDLAAYATMVAQLKSVPASAFEAVDESSLMADPNSGRVVPPTPPAPGRVVAVSPRRLLTQWLGPGGTTTVQVTDHGATVPDSASAAILNITVTGGTRDSYIAAYPGGTGKPNVSTLNFSAGTQAANVTQVAVGPGGGVTLYNSEGGVLVMADLEGYISSSPPAGAGYYRALPGPRRAYDSRTDQGGPGPIGPNQSRFVPIAGTGSLGVPASGAGAVAVNLTSVAGTAASYLAATPTGGNAVSTVNFGPADVRPNRALVKLGSGGISIYNSEGWVDFIVDVAGWFTDGSDPAASGGVYHPLLPLRILDTRPDYLVGTRATPLDPRSPYAAQVAGVRTVPAGATTAVLNVTVTNPDRWSYLTVYPSGSPPVASDLNFRPGQTVANLVIVALGPGGSFLAWTDQGRTDLIVDVLGFY